jgi:hypothetical protein
MCHNNQPLAEKYTDIANALPAVNGHSASNDILLSVCMTGRNDNYCGNFKYRLETTLNFFA